MKPTATPVLLLAVCAGLATAGPLHFKSGTVEATALPDLRLQAAQAQRLPERAIIQLAGPMDPDRRAAIEASGARIIAYVPDNAFILDTRRARIGAINALPFVTALVDFRADWKLDPQLGQRTYTTASMKALAANGAVPAVIELFPGVNPADAARAAAEAGIKVLASELDGERFILDVTGSADALRAIATNPDVKWIEPAPEVTFRSNTNTRWIVQTNQLNNTPVYAAGLHGEDQLIAVMDGRVSVTHCSFSDPEGDPVGPNHRKIQAYNTSLGYDFHGTHVAGTALGDAGSNSNTRGIAYEARLVYGTTASFGSFASMNGKLTTHYGQGATIHTNSWGNDGTTAYDNWARAIDVFSWNNDDNLVLFAVTNGSSLKNPENAKNCLAVGATGPSGSQHSHCTGGTGPTSDGRRKPEIYAPGCSTVSSSGTSCSTGSASGTSMASPAVAGVAALVRQYYTEGFYPTGTATPEDAFVPSGPLMKATIINSAVDMTGVSGYPSNREGWGRVMIDNALYFDGQARTNIVRDVRNNSEGALDTGDVIEIPFTVTSNAEELRVTLAFHDAPGTLNTNFAPVNNIDLEVENGFGIVVKGNVFSGGFSTTGGSADAINNVEVVRIAAPFPGDFVARIRATAVNEGAQGYAVVINGAVEEDNLPGCSLADLAEPYDTLNFFDLSAYLSLYNANDPSADLAAPFGTLNFFDLSAYLALYNAGCP
tara:strand:+ start:784 stop:2922 length:2139 start_codon:yes stop_codon:yes gene_type:complete